MDDHQHIQRHISDYCYAVDSASADQIADFFWDEATLQFGSSTSTGRAQIVDGMQAWIDRYRKPVVDLRHLAHLPSITIIGDVARAQTYYDADGHSKKTGMPIAVRGVYRDRLERRGGAWRFAARRIAVFRSSLDTLDGSNPQALRPPSTT